MGDVNPGRLDRGVAIVWAAGRLAFGPTDRRVRTPMPLLQRLKRIREERGMDPRELSARSGVSADSISDFEELRRMASPRTARRLAGTLGARAKDLE